MERPKVPPKYPVAQGPVRLGYFSGTDPVWESIVKRFGLVLTVYAIVFLFRDGGQLLREGVTQIQVDASESTEYACFLVLRVLFILASILQLIAAVLLSKNPFGFRRIAEIWGWIGLALVVCAYAGVALAEQTLPVFWIKIDFLRTLLMAFSSWLQFFAFCQFGLWIFQIVVGIQLFVGPVGRRRWAQIWAWLALTWVLIEAMIHVTHQTRTRGIIAYWSWENIFNDFLKGALLPLITIALLRTPRQLQANAAVS